MSKKIITAPTYETYLVRALATRTKNQESLVKLTMDQVGISIKEFEEQLIAEFADETLSNSGSNTIGHKSPSISSDNVGDALEENRTEMDSKIPTAITETIIVLIPTDFSTIQEAIDRYASNTNDNGKLVVINIESGHLLTAGFRVENGDFSNFKITSDDAIVYCEPTFAMVSNTDLGDGVPRTDKIGFLAVKAVMPEWDLLVDTSGVPLMDRGYALNVNSRGYVRPDRGVIGTAVTNATATNGSTLDCANANFSNGGNGISAIVGARVNAYRANVSGASNTGIDVSRNSTAYFLEGNASNCGKGAYVRRSYFQAQSANFNDCSEISVWLSAGSHGCITQSTVDNLTPPLNILRVDDGSILTATSVKNNGVDITPFVTNVLDFNTPQGEGIIFNEAFTFTGEFTPQLISTGGGVPNYSIANVGAYVKKGNVITCQLTISLVDKGTLAAGDVRIGGLPAVSSGFNVYDKAIPAMGALNNVALTAGTVGIAGEMTRSVDYIDIKRQGLTGNVPLKISELLGTASIKLSITYRTAQSGV